MQLGAPLTFFLGGSDPSAGAPWIVNLVPTPETSQVRMLKPIRFSIRDGGTFIDPASIRVVAGYAKVYSNADQFFDKQLPATTRTNLVAKKGTEPTLALTNDGVFIQQVGDLNERTLYATSVDAGPGYPSIMMTAIMRPGVDNAEVGTSNGPLGLSVYPGALLPLPFSPSGGSGGSTGSVVMGIENGARNKVVYLWLQNDGSKILRLTSYLTGDPDEEPTINLTYNLNWDAFRRYTILWNEAEGYVEVYADAVGKDSRVFRVAISSIPDMPADYFAKLGKTGSIVGMYGLVSLQALDSVTISNVALTTDVGYPVLGTIRPGTFVTSIKSAEIIRTTGDVDPRETVVSSWLDMPESLLPAKDSTAVGAATAGIFAMTKPTVNKTFAIYREEPGLLKSNDDGWMVEARLHAAPTATVGAATGMGFTVFDGQNVFQVQLFKDPGFNTVGILKKNGSDFDITEHYLPEDPLDWKGGHTFRLMCDPRRGVVSLYDGDDLNTPVMSVPFDRAQFPSAGDKGWADKTPFIALGHVMGTTTSGTLQLYELKFNHLYQSWESLDAVLPTAADPAFTASSSGTVTTGLTSDNDFEIASSTGALYTLARDADFEVARGAVFETQVKITSWRPYTRTGTYVLLDDGLHTYALTFVENSLGKFAALSQRSSLGSFQEVVGRDGDAAKISFLIDWTEYHTYRLERVPYEGVKVFVDNEVLPRITLPESKLAQLPDPQFGGTPKLAFGQFTTEGSTSRWRFVRGLFSRGFDISFKKNKSDAVLRTELFKTQALIIAHAQDEDV